ncbi:hypothetical protein ACFL2A_06650, partial [Thermodesulfobacteriota bacterium]
ISRAHEILDNIEKGEFNDVGMPKIAMSHNIAPDYDPKQLMLFHSEKNEIEEEILALDVSVMTPIEALNKIYALQMKLKEK